MEKITLAMSGSANVLYF